VRSPAIRQAFDLGREPDRMREAYGRHLFGQGCLLARRLLEAGMALVSVYWHYEGPDDSPVWDTHQNNFKHLRERLVPPTDAALAALLADLSGRGLLDETLIVCMGEFGRTPRVNAKGGRDHWSAVQSVALAGGGIRGGVYGASDKLGAYPADQPVTPPDLAATLLHLLGVPPELEIRDRTDRPLRACQGTAVRGLLA
jgi:arylsulfatase A-like enzyme